MSVLTTIGGVAVNWDGEKISFTSGMTINADGSPRCYGPNNSGLDYTANGGHPGNWWAVVTHNGKSSGTPVIQSGDEPEQPCKGMYISTTAYLNKEYGSKDVRRYLDSEQVAYVVTPPQLIKLVGPVVMGCLARVSYKGKTVDAIVGDIGPKKHIGEASIACAKALGINPNPKKGGTSSGVQYEFFPGVEAVINGHEYPLQPS
jgi:hypothetical protein